MAEHAAGAAKRRRERRLRQWLRHERMTVAMVVAEATHHSAPRRLKTATAISEVEEASFARRPTGTDGSSTGGAARHPRGAWAAEE